MKDRKNIVFLALILMLGGSMARSVRAANDAFETASHNGMLKVVITKDGTFIVGWRGDAVCVNHNDPALITQFPVDCGIRESDASSFDVGSSGIWATRTGAYGHAIDKDILLIPLTELRTDSFAAQLKSRDPANLPEYPVVKLAKDGMERPFRVLQYEDQNGSKPLPYLDLSTLGGGSTVSFAYRGDFYVWARPVVAARNEWVQQFKVPALFTEDFVCYRAGDAQLVLTADGRRYQVTEKELVSIGEDGKPLKPAPTSPSSNPASQPAKQKVAMVIDRTGETPVAYRLFWDGAALQPATDDKDVKHKQAAAEANKGIEILAAAPSVKILQEYEKKMQAADQEEADARKAAEQGVAGAVSPALPPTLAQRLARIAALTDVVNDDQLATANVQRVGSAILALANRLDLRSAEGVKTDMTQPLPEELYPAMPALEQIGEHAIPAIVDAVATKDRSNVFLENAALTVVRIQGDQPAATIKVFQAAADKRAAAGNTAESQRLLKVVAILKEMQP